MAIKLYEKTKVDNVIAAKSRTTGNETSRYFDLQGFDNGLFILNCATMARTNTAKIEIFGADAADGTGGALIASHEATITSPTKMTIGYVHVNSPSNDDTLTVNGVVFTKKASADAAEREFNVIAELVAQINASVPGVTAAVDNTNYVLLTSTVPGATTITLAASNDTRLVTSGQAAQAFVEVSEQRGKRYVAARVTTNATVILSVDLIRGNARRLPVQQATAAQYP